MRLKNNEQQPEWAVNPRRKDNTMKPYYRKRFYGNEKTNLTLSEKAEKAYAEILPLLIVEYEDIDEKGNKSYVYEIVSSIYEIQSTLGDCRGISADQVNKILEYEYDEIHANEEEE